MTAQGLRERQVSDLRHGDHLCLAFADESERRDVLTSYLSTGLERGERLLYYAERSAPETVTGWLRDAGVDPAPVVADGRLKIVPVAASLLAAGRFDPDATVATIEREVADSLAAGHAGLRLTGEMDWALRDVPGADGLPDFEERVGALVAGRRATALCQYDVRRFDADRLTVADRVHPAAATVPALHEDAVLQLHPVLRDGRRELRVAGTVDYRNVVVLADALYKAAGWPGDVRLDMSALEFIDLAGVRAIAQFASWLEPGRKLRVNDLAPRLCHMVRLVGWDEEPSIVVRPSGERPAQE
ncbi:MEDS domain-containing protein [Actinocorallia sp. A-T 12471]|uniref:MEDS domain-containing protein n=1 Tax=Actinocorallia sp. A-T 12471 TaxID=3089813 RepID=UPI0029D3D5D0|nr:MEDS domain-containing protein [Actinocorallia sp. A-T 12471]MDX6742777.1 MEDS domain-containing protein [Actinocorallia sp. A-T 12471]